LWVIVRIYYQANYLFLEINKSNNYKEILDQLDSRKVMIICGYMRELNKMINILEKSELFLKMVECMKVI
jgi:hypothetical protein